MDVNIRAKCRELNFSLYREKKQRITLKCITYCIMLKINTITKPRLQ